MKCINNKLILIAMFCHMSFIAISAQQSLPHTQEELYQLQKNEIDSIYNRAIVGTWDILESRTLPINKSVIFVDGSIGGIKGNSMSSFCFLSNSTGYISKETEKVEFLWNITGDTLCIEFSNEIMDAITFQMEYINTKEEYIILIKDRTDRKKDAFLLAR